jgi:arylsulfatase A-like enzyme
MKQELHWGARLLLALGVAVQLRRWVAGNPVGFRAGVRRSSMPIAGIVLALGLGMAARDTVRERRALADLPAAPPGAPHVFLFILDTVRSVSLGIYGFDQPTTPNLERLSASRGVTFEWAITTSSWTLPSHASIMTGRYPCETRADWDEPLDNTFPTLAEFVAARGYLTAGFTANLWFTTRESGIARGFAHYEDFRLTSPGEIVRHSALGKELLERHFDPLRIQKRAGHKNAGRINRDFLSWLDRRPHPDRPIFAFLNYMDAHGPYLPREPFNSMFGLPPIWEPWRIVDRLQRRFGGQAGVAEPPAPAAPPGGRGLQRYHAEIASLDYELGRLFADLEERGLLENALILITSDHGEDHREQGARGHGDHLYLQSVLRVPLVIAWPGRVPEGMRVREPVGVRDIPATVADLIGLGSAADFPGQSLAQYWDAGEAGGREAILAELTIPRVAKEQAAMKALLRDSLHYIRGGDGREELYDFRSDPWQRDNLVLRPSPPPELVGLRTELDRILSTCAERGALPDRLLAGRAVEPGSAARLTP